MSPGSGALINSLGFFGILPEWNIQVKGYNNGGCGFQKTTTTAHDVTILPGDRHASEISATTPRQVSTCHSTQLTTRALHEILSHLLHF
jgi:hypothetical protein